MDRVQTTGQDHTFSEASWRKSCVDTDRQKIAFWTADSNSKDGQMDRKMEQVSSNLTNISGVFLFRINLPCFGANRINRMRKSWNKHNKYGGIKITTKKFLVLNVETATHFCPSLDFHLTDFGFQDCFDLIQKKLLSPAQYWQQTHLCQPSCLCLTWTRSMQLYMNSKHTNLLD